MKRFKHLTIGDILYVLAAIVIIAGILGFMTAAVYYIWNWIAPDSFQISYAKAIGILAIFYLLQIDLTKLFEKILK